MINIPDHLICLCGKETIKSFYAKEVDLFHCMDHFRIWKNVGRKPHHFEYYFEKWALSCSKYENHLIISFENVFEFENTMKIKSFSKDDGIKLPKLDFSQIKSLNQLQQKINTLLNFS